MNEPPIAQINYLRQRRGKRGFLKPWGSIKPKMKAPQNPPLEMASLTTRQRLSKVCETETTTACSVDQGARLLAMLSLTANWNPTFASSAEVDTCWANWTARSSVPEGELQARLLNFREKLESGVQEAVARLEVCGLSLLPDNPDIGNSKANSDTTTDRTLNHGDWQSTTP